MTDTAMTSAQAGPGQPLSESDVVLSRLRLIEDQPLESRAAAFAQLYDELQRRLEGGSSTGTHG